MESSIIGKACKSTTKQGHAGSPFNGYVGIKKKAIVYRKTFATSDTSIPRQMVCNEDHEAYIT